MKNKSSREEVTPKQIPVSVEDLKFEENIKAMKE
jgi:hypothetical protein